MRGIGDRRIERAVGRLGQSSRAETYVGLPELNPDRSRQIGVGTGGLHRHGLREGEEGWEGSRSHGRGLRACPKAVVRVCSCRPCRSSAGREMQQCSGTRVSLRSPQ